VRLEKVCWTLVFSLLALVFFLGCTSEQGTSVNNSYTGLPNPASVYCVEHGGRLEIRDTESGQVGYCIFDDGSECEEWAFYNGECAKGEYKNTTTSDVVSDCRMLYWYDSNSTECGYKEFCGMYMYYGLHTFETLEECEASLSAALNKS